MLKLFKKRLMLCSLMFLFLSSAVFIHSKLVSAAACAVPATDFGTVSSTISVTTTGSYRVWSRIQIASSANNSFRLEIEDGGAKTCYEVGGNSTDTPVNTWKWVDYQSGVTTNKINHSFTTTGTKNIKIIGTSSDVQLDRIIFTQDTGPGVCSPPTGKGDECANQVTSISPTFSSFTANRPIISTNTDYVLSASANDSDGTISNISLLLDNNISVIKSCQASTSSASCVHTLQNASPGTYSYIAKATDNNGDTATSSALNVDVRKPGDCVKDNLVNSADLAVFSSNYNKIGTKTYNEGDYNGDGTVGSADVAILSFGWGK